METCKRLLATEFMPHGHCYFWKDEILWPIVVGDGLTVLAYLLIPIFLIRFIMARTDMRFNYVFLLFAAFILSCGVGHFIEILNVWQPHYLMSAGVKMLTGVVSMATVGLLAYIYPQALKMPNVDKIQEMNQELSQSKEVLQLFIKHTPNALAMFDENLHYLAASDTWYTDYGIEGKEIIGKHHYDVFPEIRNMPEWQEDHKKCLAGETLIRERDPFPREDGSTDWLRYEIHPWYKDNGSVGGIIMFTEVITDRVLLENQLIESETNFRSIFYTVDQGIVYQDSSGAIVDANPAAERILGISSEEMKGTDASDPRLASIRENGNPFPPEKRPSVVAFATGKEVKDELMGIPNHKTDRITWVKVSAYPIYEGFDSKPSKVYTTLDDITEEVLVRKALESSQEKFKKIFENSAIGIALVNNDAKPEIFNERFAELLGYDRDELKQLTFAQFTHPEFLEEDLIYYHELLIGKRDSYRIEKKYIRKDRKEIWADLSVSLIHDSKGEPLYALAVVQDITDKKTVQKDLEALNTQLEARVEERTKELERINEELESFSYSVSHDLRAPLRSIKGFAQILEEDYADRLDKEGKETLDTIMQSAQQMGNLIDELLQFSRLGRRVLNMVEINMTDLVNDTITNIGYETDLSRYNVFVGQLPNTIGDPTMIKQVMVNLLTNAFKYCSKQDSPAVEVNSFVQDGLTFYTVSDNGVGFEMSQAEQLFEVFQRLETAEDFEGTGIGLALVKRIIERHGGEISAQGIPGSGSTFKFYLGERLHV